MDTQSIQEKAQEIIRKVADDLNYLIYESAILVKGEQSKVVVKIDSHGGISHGDCAAFTKELAKRLDVEKLFPNYSMEVSSPGLTRKIRSIDEFIRFKGSPVKVVIESEEGETKVIKGIINNIIDTKIELKSDNNVIIDFKNIKKANLEY